MTEITEDVTAKDRLAGTRAAFLLEMGFGEPQPASALGNPRASLTHESTPPVGGRSPWISIGKRAVSSWWEKHPANAALTLATPSLERYVRAHPGKALAYGAAVGAAVSVIRPWRLLSLTTIAALIFKRSTIAGWITRLAAPAPPIKAPVPPVTHASHSPASGVFLHLRHGHRQHSTAEHFDQPCMLRVEPADLIDHAGLGVLRMSGNLAHLRRRQLRRLGRCELVLTWSHQSGRANRRQNLVQHACLLAGIRVPEHVSHHVAEGRRLLGLHGTRQTGAQFVMRCSARNLVKTVVRVPSKRTLQDIQQTHGVLPVFTSGA